MTIINDSAFWTDLQTKMRETGWYIDEARRYNPTFITGITPTGKVFTFTLTMDGVASITVATRNRTRNVPAALYENGPLSVDEALNFYYSLPASWQ